MVNLHWQSRLQNYDDWDFSLSGRIRQSVRMKHLADGVVMAGKIAVADFIAPTEEIRKNFNPNFTVWMDTIEQGRFKDTNNMFQKPEECDYVISKWFNDTHEALVPVVKRWMEKNV